jgi:hypothetical protein
MRNAKVSALIYELLFGIYRRIEDAPFPGDYLTDDNGVVQKVFNHEFGSAAEWCTSALKEVGAIKVLIPPHLRAPEGYNGRLTDASPYSYPLIDLDECHRMDFSDFETFDNYCYAMFTFTQQAWSCSPIREYVDLNLLSPRFLAELAAKDDIFIVKNSGEVEFSHDRYEEKVMTRWQEIDHRVFRRNNCK